MEEIDNELLNLPGIKQQTLHPSVGVSDVPGEKPPELRRIDLVHNISEAEIQHHRDQLAVYREYSSKIELQERNTLQSIIATTAAVEEQKRSILAQKAAELKDMREIHTHTMSALDEKYRETMSQIIDEQIAKLSK